MTSQQQQIIDILIDGRKHCFTVELFMKDDRKRLSELRQKGYIFNEGAGYCEDPNHHHKAKVKLRQLIRAPFFYESMEQNKQEQLKLKI